MVAVLEIWVLAIVLVVSLQTQVLVISQNLACNSDDLTGLRGFMDQLESPIDGWPTNSSSCCNWFPRWLLYWRYGYLPLFLWFLFKPRLLLLMQGMRILSSGRKSSLALVLYGSIVGVVSFLTSYIPTLLRSLLLEMGIEEDLYNPGATMKKIIHRSIRITSMMIVAAVTTTTTINSNWLAAKLIQAIFPDNAYGVDSRVGNTEYVGGVCYKCEISDIIESSGLPKFVIFDWNSPWSEAPFANAAEKNALEGLSLVGFLSEWALMILILGFLDDLIVKLEVEMVCNSHLCSLCIQITSILDEK